MRRTVRLPGSIVSTTISTVASEVAGLVMDLPVQEGQRVDKGTVIARLRQETLRLRLAESQAQRREDESRRKAAQLRLERTDGLLSEGIVSQQQLDDARYEYNAWQGRVERLDAEIARLEDEVERSVIRAPFAGVILTKVAEVGEWVTVGGAIIELLSMDSLVVQVEVPERFYGQLHKQSHATVRFEALGSLELRTPIGTIIPRADLQARTFPLRLPLPNRADFGVGMTVSVILPIGEVYPALVVPKDALVDDRGRRAVFRMDAANRVERVFVETGAGLGAWIEVSGDLAVGDRIITRGNERLFPGQVVKGQAVEYPLP